MRRLIPRKPATPAQRRFNTYTPTPANSDMDSVERDRMNRIEDKKHRAIKYGR